MASNAPLSRTQRIVLGGVFLAGGVVLLALGLGLIDAAPDSVFAPLWIIALCGLVFVLTSFAIVFDLNNNERGQSWPRRAALLGVLLAIYLAFAVILTWLALGDGPRHGTTETSFLGVSSSGEADEGEVRLSAGVFAIFLYAASAFVALHAWRDLFGGRK
jgi:hypothetical protein